MSWHGFKKAVSRTGTTIMQKTGQIEKSDDSEFVQEEKKFKILEKNTNELQKQAKGYLDGIRGVSAASARVGHSVDLIFGADSGDNAMSANAYRRAIDELDEIVSKDIDGPYRATVLDPISRMCSWWPEVNTAISKRSKKLLDYDAARTRARKLVDKPAEDSTKLPRAEAESEQAREVFEMMDHQLRTELPLLLDLRIPYLNPSFECMVRVQSHYANNGYQKLGGVQRYFPEGVRDEYASGALDAKVDRALQDMKELSIVGTVA